MSLIQRKTFSINGAQVTVRSSSGFTDSKRQAVMRRLVIACGTPSEDGKRYEIPEELEIPISVFSTILVNTESVTGDLGFEWPTAGADGETLKAAMLAFDECLPAGADSKWSEAIIEVDTPPGPPELAPDAEKKD